MEKIGRYVIEKKLGQGGMGIVYKCLDPEAKRLAAVKVLPQQLAADPSFLQRFKREVMTLQRLDHPNIVRIYDQGETDGAWYYAMEFVDGATLDSILDKNEKMEPLRAIRIVRGCAQALEHSHSRGIVHRDLKPANIMLTADDTVKLTDFGIAKVLDATRMTSTQGVLGTVEYMSPEQSQGRHVDARSDLYSLGVVLYQCLTARLPITGTNPTDIIMKLRTQQIDPPSAWVPDLPKSLSALVMRLLEKEPSKRVESARELLRELDGVQARMASGPAAPPEEAAERRVLGVSERGMPTWRFMFLVTIGAVVLIVGIWLLRPRQNEAAKSPPVPAPAPGTGEATVPERALYLMARRAHGRKNYEYASDLCNVIIKYFPNTDQAPQAQKLLQTIAQDKATAPAPEGSVPSTGQPPAALP